LLDRVRNLLLERERESTYIETDNGRGIRTHNRQIELSSEEKQMGEGENKEPGKADTRRVSC